MLSTSTSTATDNAIIASGATRFFQSVARTWNPIAPRKYAISPMAAAIPMGPHQSPTINPAAPASSAPASHGSQVSGTPMLSTLPRGACPWPDHPCT